MNYSSAVVTGSNGFIGSHLMKELKNQQIEVYEASRSLNNIDITSCEQLDKMEKKEVMFHLAAITNISHSFTNPYLVYNNNVLGTLNILEWCRKNNVKKMVFLSTFVYGQPQYLPIDELHSINPTNPYSNSKYIAEQICQAYSKYYNMNIDILRLFNVYGPGQKSDFLIPRIIEQLSKGQIFLGSSTQKRDFIYIDDVIAALIKSSNSTLKGFNIFNIGSGDSYSVKDINDIISSLYFKKTGIKTSTYYDEIVKKGDVSETIADIQKAKKLLDWDPKININTGLYKTLSWYINGHKE